VIVNDLFTLLMHLSEFEASLSDKVALKCLAALLKEGCSGCYKAVLTCSKDIAVFLLHDTGK